MAGHCKTKQGTDMRMRNQDNVNTNINETEEQTYEDDMRGGQRGRLEGWKGLNRG